nr:hypothetical protein [Paraburkholderia humisilvae]
MQRKFASDGCKPAAPKPVQSLLTAQATEYRRNDCLALAEDASGLRMLHHLAKRLALSIPRIALDAPPLPGLCAFRAQIVIATGAGSVHPMLPRIQGLSGLRLWQKNLPGRATIRVGLLIVVKRALVRPWTRQAIGRQGTAALHRWAGVASITSSSKYPASGSTPSACAPVIRAL